VPTVPITPAGTQPALSEPGGGRLALGAGHPDHPHRRGGVAVDLGGQPAEDLARVVDDEQGYAGRGACRTVGVGQDGDRTGRDDELGVVDAVGARAGQRGVQVTGPDPLRAQRAAGDDDAEVAGRRHLWRPLPQPRREPGQGRPGRSARSGHAGTLLTR
jgi:hypothetical protein